MPSNVPIAAPTRAKRDAPRRGRPRDDRLDAAIVEATIAETAAKGWTGATIEGIAARAGVGRGSIYRRWSSKYDLFQYVASCITRPADGVDTGSFVEDLFAALLPIAEMLTQPELSAILPSLLAEAGTDESIRSTVRTFARRCRQQTFEAVQRAGQRGDIPADTDADALVDMLAGALVYRRLLLGEPTDADAIRALIDQAVRSCSPEPERKP
ncbi:TetR/AcrR family transcriptional regulator [Mycobacterium sp. ACS4331]|uniref:TetR/AcrR family transcriptional regulator n=1 Tax=Mycobacterium sp. ACS4331 TaxID=1834121 RepID=UPI0012FA415D|nr:TetR/AcrR family transcriptional regulator [Mycobacterium sp. ACS4331]